MSRVLYRHCRLPGLIPGHAAILVADGAIGWLGSDAGDAPTEADRAQQVDLGGALVTPAFVDAHVHATATGLALDGLDLHAAGSRQAVLDAVAEYARRTGDSVILGTGWDESAWSDPRPPTADELDQAAAGRPVYLSRVDVHSALASRALLARCPGVGGHAGYVHSGLMYRDAHHAVRQAALAAVTDEHRAAAQRRTRRHAASLGIGCLHEMAGPEVSGAADLSSLLALAAAEPGPEIVGYWGALDDIDTPRRLGVQAGGDLFCDGAIGSRTAALWEPYADRPTSGHLYQDDSAVAEHLIACTEAGLQAGFHAIGDRALAAVAGGLRKAAAAVGTDRIRAGRHRVEHAELAEPDAISTFADLAAVASVQPAFDARWGGPGGMYETRLGTARAAALNPFAGYAAAGVALAFGSDSPVTPMDPWGGIRAAVLHHEPTARLSQETAFAAATSGGWTAARRPGSGRLAVGAPATFAVWDTGEMPDLAAGEPNPVCRLTVVSGTPVG
ncbi:MAG TPA: amidohydrolase family protein [Mycobacteriales bacterium]|nr:amidohydrolase family protein [Mycobacteriales bacterium]